jgi:hypothetical protein
MCEVVTKPFKPKLLTNLLVKLIGEHDGVEDGENHLERGGVEEVETFCYPIPELFESARQHRNSICIKIYFT